MANLTSTPALALSTCWNASRHVEGESMLQEIRELGFAQVEISHGLKFSKWPGVKEAVKAGIVSVNSLHNFCPQPVEAMSSSPNCFQFSDERVSQRMTAVRHTILTIENAALLGAQAVVLHLGSAGPRGASEQVEASIKDHGWFSRATAQAKISAMEVRHKASRVVMGRVRECLEKIVPVAAEHGVRLGHRLRSFRIGWSWMNYCGIIQRRPSGIGMTRVTRRGSII
jgi:sugar phosphate isomerase/epimerase